MMTIPTPNDGDMYKLQVVSGRDCIRVLQRAGFVIDRQKGNHRTLIRDNPFVRITVPDSRKVLKYTTPRWIIMEAGLTISEFVALL
jgi:predicted RNA binding protein YcfA (HicA-like mRNA interferase family)